jgi:hypothetical protein
MRTIDILLLFSVPVGALILGAIVYFVARRGAGSP